MDIDSQENHNDPQFVKVLETCLKMEIDTLKKSLDDNIKEIKEHKRIIHNEINKRKQLKEKVTQMNKVKLILSETLTKLYTSISESSDTLELVKANADDQYKLMQIRSQEYQDIVDEYKKTWQEYRATYEEFPLAKVRKEAQIKLQKLKVEYMIVAYKKKETLTIIKQKREISWICTRNKIIEFATVMLEHMKLQKELANVNEDLNYHRKELQSIEKELQALRKKEEDQKRQRKQKMLEMPPPKINIPYREMYAQNQMRAKVQHQWKQVHESLDVISDTMSVNTLFLEELCINENTTGLPEDVDMMTTKMKDDNYKHTATEMEISKIYSKNISETIPKVISEKSDTRATPAPDGELNVEKAALTDDDIEMKESHQEETQKSQESQESVKITQSRCFPTKGSPLKHRAAKNAQDEVEAKRIRLQKEESINKITTPQPSTIIKEMDLKSSFRSIPKIKKIESVHYNITPLMPISKPVQHSTAASSMFSPMHYEYCESNVSSFDQDFTSKGLRGHSSFYEESLSNYKLSPTSNMSLMYIDEDTQMHSSPKYVAQQDDKIESDDKTSPFQFNFIEKAKGGDLF